MYPLSLQDIREWIVENRNEYQKLRSEQYPPLGNPIYDLYPKFERLSKYYSLKNECENALKELVHILSKNKNEIINWTKKYKALGSEKLIMFEIDYLDWKENVSEGIMKVTNGIYVNQKPFQSIIAFCKIFRLLYWDDEFHSFSYISNALSNTINNVNTILQEYNNL